MLAADPDDPPASPLTGTASPLACMSPHGTFGKALWDLTESAFDGVGSCQGARLVDVSAGLAAMLGSSPSSLAGIVLATLVESEDGTTPEDLLEQAEEMPCIGRLRGAQGSFPVELCVKRLPACGPIPSITYFTVRDLRRQRAAEARIRYLACHDPLTGLGNRFAMRERLEQLLAAASIGRGRHAALFCIDLDHFKSINDRHGHDAADRLLREIGWRLIETVREADLVVRLRGDKFVVVVDMDAAGHVGVEQLDGRTGVEHLAGTIVLAMGTPFDLGENRDGLITMSIGVAIFPDDAVDADTLLAAADQALRHAKRAGRAGYSMYRPEMEADLGVWRNFERDIRDGLSAGHFLLAFQPQACVSSGRLIGFEALLRWKHPERGLIPPADFIPLAERTRMIGPIGEWVLRTACGEAASWPAPLRIAVNVSPAQLEQGDFAAQVADVLKHTGLDPARLELEITETLLVRDPAHALQVLQRLKRLGVGLAMDDFGTGYSSLSALRSFPFDRIKIDRSFINDLLTCENAAAIVRAVVGLGRALHLPVVAEGVETGPQLTALQAEGCQEIQGYLIGRPAPIGDYRGATHPEEGRRAC